MGSLLTSCRNSKQQGAAGAGTTDQSSSSHRAHAFPAQLAGTDMGDATWKERLTASRRCAPVGVQRTLLSDGRGSMLWPGTQCCYGAVVQSLRQSSTAAEAELALACCTPGQLGAEDQNMLLLNTHAAACKLTHAHTRTPPSHLQYDCLLLDVMCCAADIHAVVIPTLRLLPVGAVLAKVLQGAVGLVLTWVQDVIGLRAEA